MSTMQTSAPLRRVSISSTNRPLDVLMWWTSPDHGLDMEPPYQRGDVWGVTRQRNLIRSLLLGVPIPSLVINDRFRANFKHDGWSQERCWSNAVIDGKQRITAILAFINGDLAIPASWVSADRIESTVDTQDGPYVTYPGLTTVGRRHFRSLTIAVSEGQLSTLDGEAEVFELVNFGGVPQGEKDADA